MNRRHRWMWISFACGALSIALPAAATVPPYRYTTSAGTVKDNYTGLTWERNPDPTNRNWNAAKIYCRDLPLADGGWRLPTAKELLTLVDPTRWNPAIDGVAFPDTLSEAFWSSANQAGSSGAMAWTVEFLHGLSSYSSVTDTHLVRCVR